MEVDGTQDQYLDEEEIGQDETGQDEIQRLDQSLPEEDEEEGKIDDDQDIEEIYGKESTNT